ncbi:MAG TPA: GNAT family N-acetyltransferase [Actinomycetes bacterium]|nr:GNAT family N-acetyltransferase [Actinomycetes bacterium]
MTTHAERPAPHVASSLRVLGEADLPAALEHLASDPVANVFVSARIEAAIERSWRLGGELWGYGRDREWSGLCYSGANLVPDAASPEAILAFAERARRRGRRCSSIVGPREQVLLLWDALRDAWGPARDVRRDQPLLAINSDPLIDGDQGVRRVREDELDILLPACIDMFTEEVGVSPLAGGDGSLYRARVRELVLSGRAIARIDDGQVVFKAELGSVSSQACQVQGVWVRPDLRGRGLSAPGMASVVRYARATFAPIVSLYVNDYNHAARRAYERVGFDEVGTFGTVLF